jgi:single-strand DNA-binding protein
MLKLNFIGEVLKDWTKIENANGTCEYSVRVVVTEAYQKDGKQEANRHLVVVKVWRKQENVPDFEKDLKKGVSVYVSCEMPTAVVGKNEKTQAVYGSLCSSRCRQFIFLGNGVENFIHLQGIGGITGDAQVKDLTNDAERKAINFSVAFSERTEGFDANGYPNQNTVFVNGGLFRKADKIGVAKYLTKGTRVYVEGKPTVRIATDAQGNPRAYFNAEFLNAEFVGGGKKDTTAIAEKTDEHGDTPANDPYSDGLPF